MKNRYWQITLFISVLALAGACSNTPATRKPGKYSTGEDFGKKPWVVDIEKLTVENTNFRAAKWTGTFMQLTVMSIPANGEIGLEKHDDVDQFIRVEKGKAKVMMGKCKKSMDFVKEIEDDWAIFIPAGYWHNVINIGEEDLKVYSIYTPPEHAPATVHKTAKESEEDHHHH